MNRKQLIPLLAILVLIGGAGLVLLNRNKESWAVPEAKMGDKVLPNFQPNEVAAIHIRGQGEVNLVRKDEVWRVEERNDYPANFHQISDSLIKLKNLKVVEAETVDSSQLSRVNLDEPGKGRTSGTLLEFKDSQGKVLETLLLGKKHMRDPAAGSPIHSGAADGRYILLEGNPKEVLLISDALDSFQQNPQAWLSKDFFKAEKLKSISVVSTDPAKSWKVTRDTESSPWVLLDAQPGEAVDNNKIAAIGNFLSYPMFIDVSSSIPSSTTGLDHPMAMSIQTFDHFTYTIHIGAKSLGGNYYMTVAVATESPAPSAKLGEKLKEEQALQSWVYTVSSWLVEPLLRDRTQLLAEKKEEKASDTPEPSSPSIITPKPSSAPYDPAVAPLLIK